MENNNVVVPSIFRLLMQHMTSIEPEIDESWLKPSEGFNVH